MKISIGSDHAGYEYKGLIIKSLLKEYVEVIDQGPNTSDSVDYPDYAHPVSQDVISGVVDFGILICGSGNGICMTANKHAGVRGALCWKVELAALARQHNNANIICIPARFVSKRLAIQMVKTFLNTAFEGGRHANRVQKISCV